MRKIETYTFCDGSIALASEISDKITILAMDILTDVIAARSEFDSARETAQLAFDIAYEFVHLSLEAVDVEDEDTLGG